MGSLRLVDGRVQRGLGRAWQHNVRFPTKILQRDRALPGEGVLGVYERVQLVFEEAFGLEPLVEQGRRAERQVAAIAMQCLRLIACAEQAGTNLDVRVALTKMPEHIGDGAGGPDLRPDDTQPPRFAPRRPPCRDGAGGNRSQNARHPRSQGLARRGEPNPAPVTLEERNPHVTFERLNGASHCRLHQVQASRRAAEMQFFGENREGTKITEFHRGGAW